ncbi:variable surface protein [Plasmodium gonderi]|uniref:Variable surface protein n=1 Tax=Plasmodium gonderi TaxID=77519 RepID=A0A1Y1JR61_PLAGO|nr:variable surface protein [Plasmodium gonderi]GAW83968.1 variable surface protein [Plasmodium gonderi]
MSESTTFNFKDIFPKCMNDFNKHAKDKKHKPYDDYSNYCNKLSIKKACNINGQDYNRSCMDILYYLNYININISKDEAYLEQGCKYLHYKLKDLFEKFKCPCNDPKICYNEMKNLSESLNFNMISNLLGHCSDYPIDLNEDILQMFKDIDILNDKYNIFVSTQAPNVSKFEALRQHIQYLEKYKSNNNTTFISLLEYFNNSFIQYIKSLNPTVFGVDGFLRTISEKEKTKGLLTVVEKDKRVDNSREIVSSVQMDAIIGTDSGTQISTGIIFSFFALLINMFILYKDLIGLYESK